MPTPETTPAKLSSISTCVAYNVLSRFILFLYFQTSHVSTSELLVSLEFHPNTAFFLRPRNLLGDLSHIFTSVLAHTWKSGRHFSTGSVCTQSTEMTPCHPECQVQPFES